MTDNTEAALKAAAEAAAKQTAEREAEEEAARLAAEAAAKNVDAAALLAPPKNTRAKSKAGSTRSKGQVEMPSKQAGRLTTAIKKIEELKDQGSVQGVVHKYMKDAEIELGQLLEELEQVQTEGELQAQYKQSWIKKNVTKKIEYLREVKAALRNNERSSDKSSKCSNTSSLKAALQAAREEEERIALQQRQLEEMQALRKKQREEELREKEEQDALQLKMLATRARAQALSKAASEGSKASSINDSVPAEFPLPLPRLRQPTQQWLTDLDPQKQPIQNPQPQATAEDRVERTRVQGGATMEPTGHLMQQMLLLQAQVPVFKGDKLEYLWFKRAFETQVEFATADPTQRLYQLIKHLQGEPHTLVKGCQLAENPAVGFAQAKHILEEHYGNPVSQALAFKEQPMMWPVVKTGKELRDFYAQLQLCGEIKKNGGRLQELDSSDTLLQLAAKLPVRTQASWQTKAVDIEIGSQRGVNFQDFIAFVQRQDRARNHPVFGKLDVGGKDSKKDASQAFKARTYETEVQAEAPTTSEAGATDSASLDESTGPGVLALRTEEKRKPGVQEGTKSAPDAFKAPCLFCQGDHATAKCSNTSLSKEEKQEKLRGLCFACLKPGHSARFCKFRLKCDACGALHPTALHKEKRPDVEETAKERNLATDCGGADSGPYAIATVHIRVWTREKGYIVIRAMLDNASTATFVSQKILDQLRPPTRPITLQLSTMSPTSNLHTTAAHGLFISDLEGNQPFPVGVAYVVDTLPGGGVEVAAKQLMKCPHLQELPARVLERSGPVDMLIGLNVDGALMPLDVKRGSRHEPYAVKTALGWAIHGARIEGNASGNDARLQEASNCTRTCEIANNIQKLFYQDLQDAFDFTKKGLSQDDRSWLDAVKQSTNRSSDGHYSVALPVREGSVAHLHNNAHQVAARLQGLLRKFKGNEQFGHDYCEFVQKMINSNHAEFVSDFGVEQGQSRPEPQRINYIPHHGVYHPRKPGKIRVVFNCASKFHGLSLNDCLRPGPDLTSSLVGVLLRFRQFKVAFMADIEAMFYQVTVPEAQRDLLRFLWWSPDSTDEKDRVGIYRMRVHLFGAASSPSIANYALKQAADDALNRGLITADVRTTVHRNFYVDDCLKSACTKEDAARLALGVVEACAFGHFKLGKFVSNSLEVLRALKPDQLTKGLTEVDLSEDKADPLGSLNERALGVAWNITQDQFVFRTKPTEGPATRRSVLSQLSKVYDPLGMAAPVIIIARIIFRDLTMGASEWDDPLAGGEENKWQDWVKQLPQLSEVKVPRWMKIRTPAEPCELHAFCDASTQAYAAVIYLRTVNDTEEQAQVTFVFGKVRVAPPKVVTIPRLELTAAKLAVEALNMVQAELELTVSRRYFWSDSQTVLKYIHNNSKRFHLFVANRVQFILNGSDREEWRYVPSELNPADEGSRGVMATQLQQSSWLNGPKFLRERPTCWPRCQLGELTREDPEVKTLLTVTNNSKEEAPWPETLANRVSTMLRFRRAVAVWLRLKQMLRKKGTAAPQGPFQASKLRRAEIEALKWLQWHTWPDECAQIKDGKRSTGWLAKLSPTLEGQLLVMQSRTGTSLPVVPTSRISQLLVREAHHQQLHMGRASTAAAVRKRYWVVGLNKQVRAIVGKCVECRRANGGPMTTQMSALPLSRMELGPAFYTSGVDFFGPFQVKCEQTMGKAYGVLFSCATTRAVHIEVAQSLDISSLISALRRFCARRGNVRRLVCDNGTNLSGASAALDAETRKVVRAHCRDPEVIEELRKGNVDWNFIPPQAPHQGGFYERIIRSVKKVLNASMHRIGETILTTEALTTLLCECEAILNGRPLTVMSDDPNDFEALTPNHLILGAGAERHWWLERADLRSAANALRHRWRHTQNLAKQFWHRWTNEYKSLLHERTKWFHKTSRPLKINDLVLIMNPIKPRRYWRLGRVEQVIPSADGEIRAATIRTSAGNLVRPITKLCLLETDTQ